METAKYYNKDKWMIPSRFSDQPLKAQPLEVKVELYLKLNDTTINAKGELNSYDIWRFNSEGDLNYKKTFISDSFWAETRINYDNDGYQSTMNLHHGSAAPTPIVDTTKTISIFLGNGRFKRVVKPFLPNALFPQPRSIIESFADDGNMLKQESFNDTIDLNNPYQTLITYYDGQRILKRVGIRKKDTTDLYEYYYSKEKSLDSIRYVIGRKYAKTDIFINNEYDNPAKYFEVLTGGDTISVCVMQYQYDKYGNWIKKLEKTVGKNQYLPYSQIKGASYLLMIRKIKYPDK